MTVPQVGDPAPVAASSSCTGWTSQTMPPRTIRVLRTQTGHVERVDFRQYVAEVMASGEWPGRLHMSTLEAGAVATKQYAWYYAMKGHHRPGYQHGGRCYDVRDDTADQLYRPERAHPNVRQQRAIEATWALTLRKQGRFFLTGYRAGTTSQCAADANGWKLYARSVESCARQGWSRQRLQQTYLGPNLSFVWSTQLGPLLGEPVIGLRRGSRLPDSPLTIDWRPTGVSPEVTRYALQRQVGKADWQGIQLHSPTATKARVWLKTGMDNRFRIRGTDARGRTGPWTYSDDLTAALRGPVGMRLGSASVTAKAAAGPTWARARFTGRSVALVAPTGPGMGRLRVFVNGRRAAIVDLHRDVGSQREFVWTLNFGTAKPRSIAVRAVDASTAIDFQGFYVLR
jgi:hypothetical protein